MHIIGIGYRTIHGKDFEITRPCGYGEYLLLLMETSSFHVLNAQKQIYPAQSVLLYDKQHRSIMGQRERIMLITGSISPWNPKNFCGGKEIIFI